MDKQSRDSFVQAMASLDRVHTMGKDEVNRLKATVEALLKRIEVTNAIPIIPIDNKPIVVPIIPVPIPDPNVKEIK